MKSLAAVLLALGTAACLETSPEPFTAEPDVALDPAMVGRWRCVSPDDARASELTLSETSPKHYRLHFETAGDEPADFEGHASLVGTTTVLNTKEKDQGWYFAVPRLYGHDLLEWRLVPIESKTPDPREQARAALAAGDGLLQMCACVRSSPE